MRQSPAISDRTPDGQDIDAINPWPAVVPTVDGVTPSSAEREESLAEKSSPTAMVGSVLNTDEGLISGANTDPPGIIQQYLVSPTQSEPGEIVHMITIILRGSGDKTRDVLRLRRIHGTVMSYPGKDRFAFHVFERGRGYLVEFPNFTTGMCPELISRLRLLVGSEQVRIEPITFQ